MTLNEHIRDLCAKATAAQDPKDVERTLAELRAALKEHSANVKMLLARYPVPSDHLVRSSTPLVSSDKQQSNLEESSASVAELQHPSSRNSRLKAG
ncbi:MAG: hypothetical protein JWO91_1854 [Acidobacteriaceae bacterium]|jgi:hypothetical protein|nr:hypothetical protein [Acidobacteriaceae bacterium]